MVYCPNMTDLPGQGTNVTRISKPFGQTCEYCHHAIMDRDMLTDSHGTFWHNNCLKCCRCDATMADNVKFYPEGSRVYCEYDYHANRPIANQTQCYKCYGLLGQGEVVQEAVSNKRWFFMHERCFVCDVCSRPLKSGTNYIFYKRWMVCEDHFSYQDEASYMHEEVKQTLDSRSASRNLPPAPEPLLPAYQPAHYAMTPMDPHMASGHTSIPNFSRVVSSASSDIYEPGHDMGLPPYTPTYATHHVPTPQAMSPPEMYRYHPYAAEPTWYGGHPGLPPGAMLGRAAPPSKQRRIRTSFTDEQHRILTESFEEDPTPDSSDLERIGRLCELPKRTVQIWFQNARARSKKTRTDTPSSSKSAQTPTKTSKAASAFTGSPATTPSTLSATESASSESATHGSDPHTAGKFQSQAAVSEGKGRETTGGMGHTANYPTTGIHIKAEGVTTPLSVERSPLGGSQAIASAAARHGSTTDWSAATHSTGFEHMDYFQSPPFTRQDLGLLDDTSLADGKSPS